MVHPRRVRFDRKSIMFDTLHKGEDGGIVGLMFRGARLPLAEA